MTYDKDDIHKLAIKAGFHWEYALDEAEEIAALVSIVRAEALEEAAKVCESKEIPFDIDLWRNSTKREMTAHTAIALAAAIRGMK